MASAALRYHDKNTGVAGNAANEEGVRPMCGRMIVLTYDEVREVLRFVRAGAQNPYPDWPAQAPRDAFPQDDVPIVVPGGTGELASAEPQVLRWGYPVDWQPGPVFNTRVESMMRDYGMWRESAGNRRCLVPTRGFYERHGSQKERSRKTGRLVKRQYEFELVDEPITWLAGVCADGRFSVVTTAPNRYVAPIHDRMPLVLRASELSLWLGNGWRDLADRSAIELDVRPEHADDAADGGQLSLF